MSLQHILKNSSVSGKEPLASQLANGELSINYHADGPFLCCKDTAGNVRRVAGVWVSATAPSTPFPGELWLDTGISPSQLKVYKDSTDAWVFAGEVNTATTTTEGIVRLATNAEAQGGTSTTSAVTPAALQSKISDSTSTTSSTTIASSTAVKAVADTVNAALPKSGGTITGILEIGNAGQLRFEGSSNDAYETTLAVEDPTATRAITLPDRSGTVITTGDTGTITSTMIADGTIVNADINASASIAHSKLAALNSAQVLLGNASNVPTATTVTGDVTISNAGVTSIASGVVVDADINASAAIAGTKISPDFGSQNVATTGDITIGDKIIHADDTNTAIRFPANDAFSVETDGNERLRVDSNGRLLLGTSSSRASRIGTISFQTQFQIETDSNTTGIALSRFTDGISPNFFAFQKARGTIASPSAALENDATGTIIFSGYDGTNWTNNAQIRSEVDGTPSANDMPGRLIFTTTADGNAAPAERLRIDSSGTTTLTSATSSSPFIAKIGTSEVARIDGSGRLLVGTSTYRSVGSPFAPNNQFYSEGAGSSYYEVLVGVINRNDVQGPVISLGKSRGTSVGSNTTVQDGDQLGIIRFSGADGTHIQTRAAEILVKVDGTPGSNVMPGRLVFSTTPSGSATPTERLRIDSSGFISLGGDTDTGLSNPSANNLAITTGGSERLRVDGSGRLLVGTSTALAGTGGLVDQLQVGNGSISVGAYAANQFGNRIQFAKSRNPTTGSQTVVQSGDTLGYLEWAGSDGTNLELAARITAVVDASPSAGSMPGRLILSTTPSGSTTPTERLRLDSSGRLGLGTSSPSARLAIGGTPSSGVPGLDISDYNANVADTSDIVLSSNGVIRSSQSINNVVNTSGYFAWKIGGSDDKAGIDGSSDVMRIDSSGNVGIGTTSPENKLHVVGTSATTNGGATILVDDTASVAAGIGGSIAFRGTDGSTTRTYGLIRGGKSAASSGAFDGFLAFETRLNGQANTTERLRITNTGLVGVGTTSPGALLDITESAVSQTPNVSSPLVVRRAGGAYVNLLSDNTTSGGILWGDTDNAQVGRIVYSHSDNSLAAYTVGTEKLRIDSSGRLLVGTSTSTALLGYNSGVQFAAADGTFSAIRNTANTGSPEFVSAKSRGSTGSPSTVLDGDGLWLGRFAGYDGTSYIEAARISAAVDGTPSANDMPGRLVFSTTADGASSPTERMRIDAAGNTLFVSPSNKAGIDAGTTDGKYFSSTGGILISSRTTTTTVNHQTFINGNGAVGSISTNGSATAYNTSSDYRLKENVTPVTDGITRLQQLKPSRFNFIADPTKTVDGFLAHEVQAVVPEAITGEKDAVDAEGNPEYQGIDQSKLVPLLTAALQEAIGEIESLKARVAALEAQ